MKLLNSPVPESLPSTSTHTFFVWPISTLPSTSHYIYDITHLLYSHPFSIHGRNKTTNLTYYYIDALTTTTIITFAINIITITITITTTTTITFAITTTTNTTTITITFAITTTTTTTTNYYYFHYYYYYYRGYCR